MNPAQILSVLSALAATVWSVLTWSEEQQKGRELKRDQEAALYVNPFLLAIDELQSRLYSILEEDELAFYKKEYPDQYEIGSPAAIGLLYHLSQYFGWVHHIFRYGPYTKDPVVIELIRKIADTFESRCEFSGDAFRFSIDERSSLGEAVVRRIGEATAILPVLESIPLFQFEEEISDKLNRHAPLYQSKAVRCTLSAIDMTNQAEALEGHERLAVLQNLLVDLLAYLESEEGFRVSLGGFRKARLKETYAGVSSTGSNIARIAHQTSGRIRVKVPRLKKDKDYANRLQSLLEKVENVRSIRINIGAASVIISYSTDIPEVEFANRVVKTIEEGSYTATVL
ncbi:MAG: HMA2 domain-containing protein [Dissulfurispiraceae bacterium]